jgi:cell division control protein 45
LDLFSVVKTQTQNKEIGTIMFETELRLMLLRHWNLFESLSNSTYVVSKMKLWREPG